MVIICHHYNIDGNGTLIDEFICVFIVIEDGVQDGCRLIVWLMMRTG